MADDAVSCEPFSAPCAIYRTRAPIDALGQLGVEHDLGLENLGDWAVLLGVSRQIGELCFVEVWALWRAASELSD